MVQVRLLDLLNNIDDAIERNDQARALRLILKNWEKLPDPSPLRERTAVLLATQGRKREAVEIYRLVARHYANAGFPTRALAAIKQMQALNPASTQLLDHFTTLYSVRSPFLERRAIQKDFPVPVESLECDVADQSNSAELESLFEQAIERANSKEKTAERPAALPPLTLLSLLPPEALRRLLDFLDYEIFAETQPIFDPQRQGDLIWTVSDDLLVSGEEESLRVPAGALLGLSSFSHNTLGSVPRTVSQKGSECLRLSQRAIEALSEEFPDFPNRLATLRRHALTEGIFERHPMFADLDNADREEVCKRLVGLKLETGTTCLRQGKVSPGLYIVLDGEFDILCTNEDIELTVETLGAGAMFGEAGLVTPRPALATAIARDLSHVLFLAREDFNSLSERFPGLARFASAQAERRIRAVEEALSGLDLADVP